MISRNLDKAREAYRNGNALASLAAHTATEAKEEHRARGQYIKSLIYGGLDGIITTFAVAAGVAGASLSAGIVLTLGFPT